MKIRKELLENAKSIDIATPEEKAWVDGYMNCLDEIRTWSGGRFRKMVESVRERRVLVLPCKVGDTVYSVSQELADVRPYIVDRVIEPYFRVKDAEDDTLTGGVYLQAFGRTMFTTREEAEKALEEAKRDG